MPYLARSSGVSSSIAAVTGVFMVNLYADVKRTRGGERALSLSDRGIMRRFFRIIPILAAIQVFTAISAFGFYLDPTPDPEPPLVICDSQQYALCAEASCFVYAGVAYCKCDIKRGDSISLQLSYSSPAGERNVCDVNQQVGRMAIL